MTCWLRLHTVYLILTLKIFGEANHNVIHFPKYSPTKCMKYFLYKQLPHALDTAVDCGVDLQIALKCCEAILSFHSTFSYFCLFFFTSSSLGSKSKLDKLMLRSTTGESSNRISDFTAEFIYSERY